MNELPAAGIMAKQHVFEILSFNSDDQSGGLPVLHDEYALSDAFASRIPTVFIESPSSSFDLSAAPRTWTRFASALRDAREDSKRT